MTMTTTMFIIIALLAVAFLAVRLFGKPKQEDGSEVMRVTRKNRGIAPEPE